MHSVVYYICLLIAVCVAALLLSVTPPFLNRNSKPLGPLSKKRAADSHLVDKAGSFALAFATASAAGVLRAGTSPPRNPEIGLGFSDYPRGIALPLNRCEDSIKPRLQCREKTTSMPSLPDCLATYRRRAMQP
jgi:hypothetical protein